MSKKRTQAGRQKRVSEYRMLAASVRSLFGPERFSTRQSTIQTKEDALKAIETAREEFERELYAERWSSFVKRQGEAALSRLVEKHADRKFIISTLYYLWDPSVPTHDYEIRELELSRINAVYLTRHMYLWLTEDDETTQKIIGRSLARMQRRMENELRDRDYEVPRTPYFEIQGAWSLDITPSIKPQKKTRPPDDKVNRVVFVLFEHLKHKTKRPQWRDFLELLAAAGAISVGSYNSPDRRILPHVNSFEKNHPKEADVIRQKIQDASVTIRTLLPFPLRKPRLFGK